MRYAASTAAGSHERDSLPILAVYDNRSLNPWSLHWHPWPMALRPDSGLGLVCDRPCWTRVRPSLFAIDLGLCMFRRRLRINSFVTPIILTAFDGQWSHGWWNGSMPGVAVKWPLGRNSCIGGVDCIGHLAATIVKWSLGCNDWEMAAWPKWLYWSLGCNDCEVW